MASFLSGLTKGLAGSEGQRSASGSSEQSPIQKRMSQGKSRIGGMLRTGVKDIGKKLGIGGKSTTSTSSPSSLGSETSEQYGEPSSMKRGGKVRKTGLIRMHRGERVIPVKHRRKGRAKR